MIYTCIILNLDKNPLRIKSFYHNEVHNYNFFWWFKFHMYCCILHSISSKTCGWFSTDLESPLFLSTQKPFFQDAAKQSVTFLFSHSLMELLCPLGSCRIPSVPADSNGGWTLLRIFEQSLRESVSSDKCKVWRWLVNAEIILSNSWGKCSVCISM